MSCHILSRTRMRPPWSRDPLRLRADGAKFFRGNSGQASSASGHLFCRHCGLLVPQGGCTTHVLRFSRRGDDACRDRSGASLRSRHRSLPSYRPLPRGECTEPVLPCVPGAGEGQPTCTVRDARRIEQRQRGGPRKGAGSGCTASVLWCVRKAVQPSLQSPSVRLLPGSSRDMIFG